METREYFEKVMQDYRSAMLLGSSKNQNRNGRSLCKNYKPLPKDDDEGQKEAA